AGARWGAAGADRAAQCAGAAGRHRGRGERGGVSARGPGEEHHGDGADGGRGEHGLRTMGGHGAAVAVRSGEAGARLAGGPAGATRAGVRALELTGPIARQPERVLSTVIEELADRVGEAPALLSDRECLTYRGLGERANRYARWALAQGVGKGEAVGLLMPNRPEYLAIWLGITRVGGVVALLNPQLTGPALAQSINLVAPRHLIVAGELGEQVRSALPLVTARVQIWAHGLGAADFPRIDGEIERYGGERLGAAERRPVTIEDRALYIYTSGTTGLPKAATVSHGRLMQWSHWFAGLLGTGAGDRMYTCLPLYHSVGGVVAPGAVLVGGGSVVVRVRFDVEQEAPVRDAAGFCVRCGPNEVGEAIGQMVEDPGSVGSRFEGYTSPEASEQKILRDVFAAGDVWYRTGDLMRKDARGYFYFVDRIGETFRWKGENVATCEVA